MHSRLFLCLFGREVSGIQGDELKHLQTSNISLSDYLWELKCTSPKKYAGYIMVLILKFLGYMKRKGDLRILFQERCRHVKCCSWDVWECIWDSRKKTPGSYQRLDLFMKVLRVLCPNLTDDPEFSCLLIPLVFILMTCPCSWWVNNDFQEREMERHKSNRPSQVPWMLHAVL